MNTDDSPQSVEEAGALLGAAITRCGVGSHAMTLPPKGMHSSFATITPVPASELFLRLHSLRSLLRCEPQDSPLIAAPSLLAVLMKLLSISSSLASKSATSTTVDASKRVITPPMLSTPLRKIWVDCVVLCHQLGEGLTGKARIDTYAFLRSMLSLASLNPKSAKAAGGTRIAALDCVGGLFINPKLTQRLAPWALDVLQVCHKALKSSGNGEPTYRISATLTACCVAVACRQSSLITRPLQGKAKFVLRGAVEEKAILEAIKLLKQATTDKFPEVRSTAAKFAATLAPMLVLSSMGSGKPSGGAETSNVLPTSSLDEVMSLSMKNLDDESPEVALSWAEALARCVSTAVEYGQQSKANIDSATRRNAEDEGAGPDPSAIGRQITRKSTGLSSNCSTLNAALSFLVDQFIKSGGELAAPRGGGPFSLGGRAVRAGLAMTLVKLVRLQLSVGMIGEDGLSIKDAIATILKMVGESFEKQINSTSKSTESLDATSPHSISPEKAASSLFGQGKQSSQADGGLVRLAVCRVLRQGLSEGSSEPLQLTILNELVRLCKGGPLPLNPHQLQVILIEMSHLVTALGDSTASSLSDAIEGLRLCLVHVDHGVRHEAAQTCAAFAVFFNVESRKLVRSSVDDFQLHHAELFALASTGDMKKAAPEVSSVKQRRFRRSSEPKQEDPSVAHQCAIHGYALMVSILLKELPRVPGGLPSGLLATALSAAEILVSCQYNDVMTQANPGAACVCVRAGYGIICGALTVGSEAVAPHIANIFGLWQKSYGSAGTGGTYFSLDHDLICLDAMISSVVVFLAHCSDLLLAVPDALSRTTVMLEHILLLFLPGGRLGNTPNNPSAASRHQSAMSFIMEAFAWLPPGSFPMAAEGVFSLAAGHIHSLTEEEVTCSILSSLVNREDWILDARSLGRARRVGQVGGARDLEETITWLTSDTAHPGERESVLHLRFTASQSKRECITERGSFILGFTAFDSDEAQPPTPLHEVGTWREPLDPFCSTKVRLIDASIQAFAATFGMKGGKEQQAAVDALETLIPPFLAQLARAIGVNSALTESERRTKSKEENAAVANITAVLLACLKSLPLHEASLGVPIGLGPPWMKKAKDLLLTLMPSTSNVVRRAATEGLALLATLCVTEDAHFLQSTVLHSLDEVMQGNNPDGKPKTIPLEPVSAARAGSLLTLACIQRTSNDIKNKQNRRSRSRVLRGAEINKPKLDELPTLQMMTRILPSVVCYGLKDAFVVRTYAIHSLGLLLSYSGRMGHDPPSSDDLQLIRKGVEIVEDNFLSSWTAASSDLDRGMESEKLEREASFLAVLLRLMTHLVPSLRHVEPTDRSVANRFSYMATLILECFQTHPVVFVEGMAFFEVMISRHKMLPLSERHEGLIGPVLPFILESLSPELPNVFFTLDKHGNNGLLGSPVALWAVLHVVKQLTVSHDLSLDRFESSLAVSLYALLELTCAARCFPGCTMFRSLAAPREVESNTVAVEADVVDALEALLCMGMRDSGSLSKRMLQWILVSRTLTVGSLAAAELDESERNQRLRNPTWAAAYHANKEAFANASLVFSYAAPLRWQVKSQAVKIAILALESLAAKRNENPMFLLDSPSFNPVAAKRVLEGDHSQQFSFLVLHLGEVLTAACTLAVATLEQSELRWLQSVSIQLLEKLIVIFGWIEDPDQPNSYILSQYSTQIASSVKHALTAPDEDDLVSSKLLFLAGCMAIHGIHQSGLTEDKALIKRLSRLTIPDDDEIPFFELKNGPLEDEQHRKEIAKLEGVGCSLLPIVGKLWTLGSIALSSAETDLIGEIPSNVKLGIAVHSAAVAMDGARILLASGLSLCGSPICETLGDKDDSSSAESILERGLLFRNIKDIDDLAKATLARAWSSCGANALRILFDILSSREESEERLASCLAWLTQLIPLVLSGAFVSFSHSASDGPQQTGWAPLLDSYDVVADCLCGLSALVKGAGLLKFDDRWNDELDKVSARLSSEILLPSLRPGSESKGESCDSPMSQKAQRRLVLESCRFHEMLAASESLGQRERPALMMAVLGPLNAVQNGSVGLDDPLAEAIVISSLKSASSLIKLKAASESLLKAMLQVATHILHGAGDDKLKDAATDLLGNVVDHNTITLPMQQTIACEVATTGNWAAWSALCRNSIDGRGISRSLSILQRQLSDYGSPEHQLAALSAVRQVVQQLAPKPVVGRILHGVGHEVFGILHAYGTLKVSAKNYSYRTPACSDGVKIAIVAYQQLSSEEESLPAFLTVLFASFISMIRFNGLPNYPSPHDGADAALGRMSAQSIVYVARTTPSAFKASLAALSEQDRAVLELAVRAEMSGYAAPTLSAPKKKLDLKHFKS